MKKTLACCFYIAAFIGTNNVVANYDAGVVAYETNNLKEAVTEFERAASQGDSRAQTMLGYMYTEGLGVLIDYEKSISWYKKAATQGNKIAQYNLGLIYHLGKGVAKDYKEAFNWYKKSAEQGLAEAQYSIGQMYHNGEGVSENHKQALNWYTKAAESGHLESRNMLFHMYMLGLGTERNRTIAYALANALNDSDKMKLAERFLNSEQVSQAKKLSIELKKSNNIESTIKSFLDHSPQ